MRSRRWAAACAVAGVVILVGIAFVLISGGWRGLKEAWVVRSLRTQGVEVYAVGDSGAKATLALFPARRYELRFSDGVLDLRLATRLRWVTDLSLENLQLRLDDCKELGKLDRLESLDLVKVAVPTEGWLHMGRPSSLLCLSLTDVTIGEQGVRWLAHLPSLVYLAASEVVFSSPDSLGDEVLPSLREASFQGCEMEPGFLAALSRAPVEKLWLVDCRFPKGGVEHLGALKNVRLLWLFADLSGREAAGALQPLHALESVHVSVTSGADEVCRSLGGLSHVVEVRLNTERDTGVGDDGLKHLAGLSKLRSLFVRAGGVTDAGAKCLGRCRQLHSLGLIGSQITDGGLRAISQLPELFELQIPGSRISDDALGILMTNKALRILDVSETSITDRSLTYVKDWPDLQVLYLRKTKVTPAGVAALRQQRPDVVVVSDETKSHKGGGPRGVEEEGG